MLHLDKDFDLIAEITGQPIQRLTIDSAAGMDDAAEQTEALPFPDSGPSSSHRYTRQTPNWVRISSRLIR